MARLYMGERNVPIGLNMAIESDLKPGATITLTADKANPVRIWLDFDEVMRLAVALKADKRFSTGGKPPKPDADLASMADRLFDSLVNNKYVP